MIVAGRYSFVREVGRGAMGVVFEARRSQPGGDVPVAMKLLPVVPHERAYAVRGARLAHGWRHENLIAVYDVTETHAVLEWVDGLTAIEAAKSAPMPWPVLRSIVSSVASALAYMHERRAVHRDVKPSNVMLSRTGRVVLVDYDLVTDLAELDTICAGFKGTRDYASPSALQGFGRESADIYALAASAYHLAVGRPPEGDDPGVPDSVPDDLAAWIIHGLRMGGKGPHPVLEPGATTAEIAAYVRSLPARRRGTELAGTMAADAAPAARRRLWPALAAALAVISIAAYVTMTSPVVVEPETIPVPLAVEPVPIAPPPAPVLVEPPPVEQPTITIDPEPVDGPPAPKRRRRRPRPAPQLPAQSGPVERIGSLKPPKDLDPNRHVVVTKASP